MSAHYAKEVTCKTLKTTLLDSARYKIRPFSLTGLTPA